MTRVGNPIVALLVLVAAWVPAIGSVVIAWVFELPEEPLPRAFLSAAPEAITTRFDDIGVTVALIYGALSALLIARRPHPVAVILAVHAIGSGLAAFGVQWGLLGEQVPGLPLWGLFAHAAGWGFVPGTFATTFVPLLVLRRPMPVLHRVVVGLGLGIAALASVAAITNQSPAIAPNPFAIDSAAYQEALPVLYGTLSVSAIGVSVVITGMLVHAWLVAAEDRARLSWLVVGHLFLTASYAALVVPAEVRLPPWMEVFGMVAPVVGQLFYPAAILVMVLGPRLRGIDVAVSRVLAGVILAVVAATAYLVLGSVFSGASTWSPQAVGIVSAALVVLALQPGRRWLQDRVDRLVYPDGRRPAELVQRLGERVGEIDSGAEGLAALASGLRVALRLGSVELASLDRQGPGARAGVPSDAVLEVPLLAGDTTIGALRVTPRRGERVSRRTRRELEELAGPVAAVLQLAQANETLERARGSVLAARQAARRTLRRELHDGIGPALAGIGFGLAAVDNLVDEDPAAARRLVRRLTVDLRERLAGVRELARGLRPSGSPLDLATELEALAVDFSGAGPVVVVDAPAAALVPVDARRPAYLVAAEAVHNAVRHAHATRIAITLRADREVAVLSIADDGAGFTAAGGGVGLSSMREHAAEAAAEFSIESIPGSGTAVRARIPLVGERVVAPESQEVPA